MEFAEDGDVQISSASEQKCQPGRQSATTCGRSVAMQPMRIYLSGLELSDALFLLSLSSSALMRSTAAL